MGGLATLPDTRKGNRPLLQETPDLTLLVAVRLVRNPNKRL